MTTVDSEKTKQVDAGKPDRSIDAASDSYSVVRNLLGVCLSNSLKNE